MSIPTIEAKASVVPIKQPEGCFSPRSPQSLPELPEDVFLIILRSLHPWDVVRCRRVSKAWRLIFSKAEYLHIKLKEYFRAREVRELSHQGTLAQPPSDAIDWQGIFDKVASRYYHLRNGKVRSIMKYKMAVLDQFNHWYPVTQWDYHESQPGGRLYYEHSTHISRLGGKPYLFRQTFWTYDDGLLVFAPDRGIGEVESGPLQNGYTLYPLAVVDVETGDRVPIPFNMDRKILRNIRLKQRTLVIEWAEKEPFHDLNDSEKVHRHFSTCFDIQPLPHRSEAGIDLSPLWTVAFRSEWKMHFLGLPLNHRDRFFSIHNATHYAVYFWQPNRSMYTGDEEHPLESLSVWDISTPSSYLPSTDPTGQHLPKGKGSGPRVVSKMSFPALDYLGIRQHSSISLMNFHLDSASRSLIWRENTWAAGQGYFDPAERRWCARTVIFPFAGLGPAFCQEWDGSLPPYRGHVSMDSAELLEGELESWFLPIMDVVDEQAGVRFELVETCFSGQTLIENRKVIRIKVNNDREGEEDGGGLWVAMDDRLVDLVSCMGRIAGDERWLVGQSKDMELVVLRF